MLFIHPQIMLKGLIVTEDLLENHMMSPIVIFGAKGMNLAKMFGKEKLQVANCQIVLSEPATYTQVHFTQPNGPCIERKN